ncbi:MAG: OmpA family protein [Chitinophaga sp.]|uniref:OmpA family protein n=1 Tax=Chitinophaga sp. TaxID=1869181 RepID=UPI0025BF8077|nr:OmpA family protein [Chitinophaga sp.]MBV8256137.1 OmpA family protein [Chitinophaga sp.]
MPKHPKRKYIPGLLLTFLAAGMGHHANAQYAYTEAMAAFRLYNFEKATPLFIKAFHKKPSAKAARGAADCYRLIKDYQNAAIWYAQLWQTKGGTSEDELRYAAVLMNNEKYDTAAILLDHYLQENPNSILGRNMREGCNTAPIRIKEPVKGRLENMAALNSPYSDWSITKQNSKYIFASDRPYNYSRKSPFFENENIKKKMYTWTGNSYLHLYESNGDSTNIHALERGNINGDYHSSNASYNANGTTMYLAVTSYRKKTGSLLGKDSILTMNIAVKEVTRNNQDKWIVSPELPFNAMLQYSVGDPWISPAGDTLYFVATQGPDHQGGTDIYYVIKAAGQWGTPVNMGTAINTPGNERTPSFDPEGHFYFASDGHPGLGGLDIFQAEKQGSKWTIHHMGTPVNSSHDDFAPAVLDSMLYFASNRDGGLGSDDIYRFIPEAPTPQPVIKPVVTEKTPTQPAPEATVQPPKKQIDFTQLKVPYRLDNIYFDLGKSDIRPEAAAELDKLVTLLQEHATMEVELAAHTDSRANDAFNLALSQRRAAATVAYLVKKGIAASRLTAKGYGETRLVNKCANGVKCTEAEHLQNRRTELIIIKL